MSKVRQKPARCAALARERPTLLRAIPVPSPSHPSLSADIVLPVQIRALGAAEQREQVQLCVVNGVENGRASGVAVVRVDARSVSLVGEQQAHGVERVVRGGGGRGQESRVPVQGDGLEVAALLLAVEDGAQAVGLLCPRRFVRRALALHVLRVQIQLARVLAVRCACGQQQAHTAQGAGLGRVHQRGAPRLGGGGCAITQRDRNQPGHRNNE